MNLSFLVILTLLVLFFILKQHNRDCIECTYRFMFILGLVLVLYETYMHLSYEKIKDKDILKANEIKRV